MEHNDCIRLLLENENGFTADEKQKLTEGFDAIYIDSRIKHHQRMARKQAVGVILLILFALLAFGILIFGSLADTSTQGWLKGLATGYFFALIIIFPKTFRNHSRLVFVLKTIKQLQEKMNQ